MSQWLWRGAAAIGVVLFAGLLLVPDGIPSQVVWIVVSLVALAATVIGPRLHPPRHRHQGWLLSVAMAGFVITNVIGVVAWEWPADHVAHLVGQLLFPVSYLLIGLAMLRLAAVRTPDGDPESRIDSLLVFIATGAVLYDLITAPGVAGSSDAVERTIFAALPLVQAPVIAAAIALLITGSHRHPAAWCLLVAATGGMVGNIVFVLGVSELALLASWFTAYFAVTIATLHPSFAELSGRAPVADDRLSFGRLAVIGIALLALPAVMLLGQGGSLATSVPASAAAVCVVLVLWRMARLLREREQVAAELHHRAEREAALVEQLRHRSLHDPLTDLPNRALVLDRLQVALAQASRPRTAVGVLFLDLDGFKAVNDTLGHAAGDRLLIEVSRRLRDNVRPGDTVGRLAGDEFVIVGDATTAAETAGLADRLDAVLRRPYVLDGREVRLSASIGLATAGGGAEVAADPEQVLRWADAAMYRSKRSGGGAVTWDGREESLDEQDPALAGRSGP